MKSFRILIFKSLLFILPMALIAVSCKKDEEKAPELPPQSSFVMDFSDFSNPNDTLSAREIATYQNWGYSYTTVVIWQSFLVVGLAVPVASFNESFNHEAVYHPDTDKWTWSYNVTVNLVVYEAELTGYLEADSVIWEMRITTGNQYSNFLWYYGISALDNSWGYWVLQENPQNPNPLLRIEWHNWSFGRFDIRYTNIKTGAPENGTYIFYETALADFRSYNIYNKGLDNLTVIEWSSINKDGHVKDPHHFGNNDFHCWDGNLIDVVCP